MNKNEVFLASGFILAFALVLYFLGDSITGYSVLESNKAAYGDTILINAAILFILLSAVFFYIKGRIGQD
ncbi:hypothetical protein GF323_06000 [Candidatus Woesearchaeota archaeon]|nr:hypothetical protein [Candidatus Woesearchaeota archaeon]